MALNDFLVELDRLVGDATAAFQAAADADALEAVRIEFSGPRAGGSRPCKRVSGSLTGRIGRRGGNGSIRSSRRSKPRTAAPSNRWRPARKLPGRAAGPLFDPTVRGAAWRLGHLHPITQTIEDLKEIMGRLGFSVADGPEVEDPRHNFEALNIPPDHPARDPLENFYLAGGGAGSEWQGPSRRAGVRARHQNMGCGPRSLTRVPCPLCCAVKPARCRFG